MSRLSIIPYFPFTRMKITDQVFLANSTSVLVQVDPDLRYAPLCHICKTAGRTVHSQGHRRPVRDLNLAAQQVWLDVEYRQIECSVCGGVRVEHLSFCAAGRRITHRLAEYIYGLCQVLTVEEVARHLELDPKTVKAVDYEYLSMEFGKTDYSNLRVLAIDEIALKKGHRYMTVVLDYLTGRVVWMGEGRSMETLDEFFQGMTPEQKAGIEAVAMDMWEPYIQATRARVPEAAEKIVFDRFHIMGHIGKAVDTVRKHEHRALMASGDETLKGSKYLWLYSQENVPAQRREEFAALKRQELKVGRAWAIKEALRCLWHYVYPASGWKFWKRWYFWATHSRLEPIRKAAETIRRHIDNILTYYQHPITNAMSEGLNSQIQKIKSMACGFRNIENFKTAIYFHCGGLDLYPC